MNILFRLFHQFYSFFKKEDLYVYRDVRPVRDFKNISPDSLKNTDIPDELVSSIWVTFMSRAGKKYTAVHVFDHPTGQYILLTSDDKDQEDFVKVRKEIEFSYIGQGDEILDRSSDICSAIHFIPRKDNRLTQRYLANKVDRFFSEKFNETKITVAHYAELPESCKNLPQE